MQVTAIVLAGGKGSRMHSDQKKQYMLLAGEPLVVHSLRAFQNCSQVDRIILVCGKGEISWCEEQLLDGRGLDKVTTVTEGGRERYHSVWEGLKAAEGTDVVLIHDGARPFITDEMIRHIIEKTMQMGSCVAAVPAMDTIKLASEDQIVQSTLPRDRLWVIQTPQAFWYEEIYDAYQSMEEKERQGQLTSLHITDDAMVMETFGKQKVYVGEGSEWNRKITTPSDLVVAEALIRKLQ